MAMHVAVSPKAVPFPVARRTFTLMFAVKMKMSVRVSFVIVNADVSATL